MANKNRLELGLRIVAIVALVPIAILVLVLLYDLFSGKSVSASIWWFLTVVYTAGGAGGFVGAVISKEIAMPDVIGDDSQFVIRPGVFGNIVAGGFAGVASWGLYGPFPSVNVIGPAPATPLTLTLAGLMGVAILGIGGARWLKSEVDKVASQQLASLVVHKNYTSEQRREISRKLLTSPTEAIIYAKDKGEWLVSTPPTQPAPTVPPTPPSAPAAAAAAKAMPAQDAQKQDPKQ